MSRVSLRRLTDSDRELLFLWRNSPDIVRLSKSQVTVSHAEHVQWFNRAVSSGDILAFIIEVNDSPAGHIRFDLAGPGKAYLSVYLIPGYTGQGYGFEAIRTAILRLNDLHPGVEAVAEVRADNPGGQAVFQKCGFSRAATSPHAGTLTYTRKLTEEEATSVRAYEQLVAVHGDSYESLDWGSRDGQLRRFAVLASIGDLDGSTILDVGCGLGHFADWLEAAGIKATYTGLELTPSLAAALKKRRPDVEVHVGSILSENPLAGRTFDYVFASGVFYTYHRDAYAALRAGISHMWRSAGKGVAFNSLSSWADHQEAEEFYADPSQTLAIVREFTPTVVLRHDYHTRDFTIFMKREPAFQ